MGDSPFPRPCRFPTMSRFCWKSPISTVTSSRKSCLFPDSASPARPIMSFTPWSDRKRGSGSLIRSARRRLRRSPSTVPPRQRPSCDSTRRETAGRVSCYSRGPTAVRSCSLASRTGRSPPCRATAVCGWAMSEPGPFSPPTNPFLVTRNPPPANPRAAHRVTACRRSWSLRRTLRENCSPGRIRSGASSINTTPRSLRPASSGPHSSTWTGNRAARSC